MLQKLQGNPFAAVSVVFSGALVNAMVDAIVSRQGLAMMMPRKFYPASLPAWKSTSTAAVPIAAKQSIWTAVVMSRARMQHVPVASRSTWCRHPISAHNGSVGRMAAGRTARRPTSCLRKWMGSEQSGPGDRRSQRRPWQPLIRCVDAKPNTGLRAVPKPTRLQAQTISAPRRSAWPGSADQSLYAPTL